MKKRIPRKLKKRVKKATRACYPELTKLISAVHEQLADFGFCGYKVLNGKITILTDQELFSLPFTFPDEDTTVPI